MIELYMCHIGFILIAIEPVPFRDILFLSPNFLFAANVTNCVINRPKRGFWSTMAFYNSYFYYGDTGEYYGTSYSTSYDIVPIHDSISHSSYEFSKLRFVEYDSTAYGDAYNPFLTRSESIYPTYNVTEPKLIEYDSIPYETQYAISHSSYEFREPRSAEYNSTAYSDACDPFLTPSEISYSSYSVTEPKLIEYDLIPY